MSIPDGCNLIIGNINEFTASDEKKIRATNSDKVVVADKFDKTGEVWEFKIVSEVDKLVQIFIKTDEGIRFLGVETFLPPPYIAVLKHNEPDYNFELRPDKHDADGNQVWNVTLMSNTVGKDNYLTMEDPNEGGTHISFAAKKESAKRTTQRWKFKSVKDHDDLIGGLYQ